MDEMTEARLRVLQEQSIEDLEEAVVNLAGRFGGRLPEQSIRALSRKTPNTLARVVVQLEDLCCV